MDIAALLERLIALIDLGGPVIAILLGLSVLVVAVFLYKIWQFWSLGVGRYAAIDLAVAARDAGDEVAARRALSASRNHVAPVLSLALTSDKAQKSRLIAMAEDRLAEVQRGFRLFDSIAQIAPLLGLFGTVLGMIDAFQALQAAGDAVDPTVLAGGIWVALLTTAAGLAVAMPTSLALTFFESRAARERARIDLALETLSHPTPGALLNDPAQARVPSAQGSAHAS
ncbi:MotA/TolQ/ExbB proton channel family protein [Roseobacter sp. HKCCD9010]|uniref:MotA/TolQ/ExbB proton channel family protein n=1 Tax=unclassified Roseobacter TaxID=196798 RepID=UPI001491AC3F|nr:MULTISPECIES: MotA/TolQ/ExbB proton channel family protein [unclassified Roseobacter]MBF9051743.1 MotA/TolQ/ExbB proton channel family protein [Rhodobacterales bacterium HKCCD4356]NNV13736.1 MotA/TolQ/ExbB proton channel family protein [Roseobacter sp. HKCCD7357]NNV17761.1 MotA/TolQ/ExbB proton channel family protein [Roseobacter sp. HKCCD8768]NNV27368.1 MotA/TolQ/ExbB proton channel family protein [Roseobacter sp. HKCCD8192]NNV31488.1 MotA/TolQ/ExbB proton channel family protein [Roseobact